MAVHLIRHEQSGDEKHVDLADMVEHDVGLIDGSKSLRHGMKETVKCVWLLYSGMKYTVIVPSFVRLEATRRRPSAGDSVGGRLGMSLTTAVGSDEPPRYQTALMLLDPEELLQTHRNVLSTTVAEVRRSFPELAIRGVLHLGTPEEALRAEASDDSLVVLRTDHRGPLGALMLGSTVRACVHSGRVPVCVVPLNSPDKALESA